MADLSDEESLDNLAQRVGNKIGLSQFTDVSAAIQHVSLSLYSSHLRNTA